MKKYKVTKIIKSECNVLADDKEEATEYATNFTEISTTLSVVELGGDKV